MKFRKTNKVGKFEVKNIKNKGAVSKNVVCVAISPRSKFKETKHDRFGKRPAATEAEDIDDRSTEEDVNAIRRSI